MFRVYYCDWNCVVGPYFKTYLQALIHAESKRVPFFIVRVDA